MTGWLHMPQMVEKASQIDDPMVVVISLVICHLHRHELDHCDIMEAASVERLTGKPRGV